jgi:hypothetical protein
VVSFYKQRHEYARGAAWMEAEFKKYAPHHDHVEYRLVEIAEVYRLAEQTDKELSILRRYYRYNWNLQPDSVESYLDLLYEKGLKEELKQAAATANLTAANYFLKKKDKGLAIIAIQALYKLHQKDPSWESIQLAMIGRQIREGSDFFDKNFTSALDLRTIGELLNSDRNVTKTIEGDDWFYYGRAYG